VCQDLAGSLEEGVGVDVIIIDFTKDFDLVRHELLIMKLSSPGVDESVVVWVREFLVGRKQRVRVGGQLSKEAKLTSGVPKSRILAPLLFLVYVNDIWRNIGSSIGLFGDDCIIYRNVTNIKDIEKLQSYLDTLGALAAENGMKINPGKSTAIRFTRARVKNQLSYSPCDQKILEASSYKYLRVILISDLNWVDHVNYIAQIAWKALHSVIRVLKKGNRNLAWKAIRDSLRRSCY